MSYKKWQKPNPKRVERIMEYRSKGYSYAQIGKIFHLSRERIRQIIVRELSRT